MADTRNVFTILEDNTSAEGVKLPARATGDTSGGNHVPAIVSQDKDGKYALVELKPEGQAVAGNEIPVLPSKDSAGNLQHISSRTEGQASSGVGAIPALGYKDPSGNLAYGKTNADGEILVSTESAGSPMSSSGDVTPTALNTLTIVTDITLTASKVYESIEFFGSSAANNTRWELLQINDVTTTVLAKGITGSGDYTFDFQFKNKLVTAGATGTQKIQLVAYQITGSLTDMHGYVGAFEKA